MTIARVYARVFDDISYPSVNISEALSIKMNIITGTDSWCCTV